MHPCFDIMRFFRAAADNRHAAAATLGLRGNPVGVLLFTEGPSEHAFRALRERALSPDASWTLRRTDESNSLIADDSAGTRLVLIAGRQIPTRERLEVLAFGHDGEFPSNLSLAEAVTAAREVGAIPVLPWGFGKWWRTRGTQVSRLLESDPGPLFLGDNGGRPWFAPEPRLFRAGARVGIIVLPGSDPLPFPSQAERVMRYGFVLEGSLSDRRPTATLCQILLRLKGQPESFGQRVGALSFVRSQIAMQLRVRRGA
jgi:hypothetical protein